MKDDQDLNNKIQKDNKNISLKRDSMSFTDITNEFFNTPPTKSIFRLYLLSFILWNKGVILYILFAEADMANKLAVSNWGAYVPFKDFLWVSLSFYFFPLFISLFIYFIVFCKIIDNKSVYDFLFYKHIESEKKRLELEKEKFEQEYQVEQAEIKKLEEIVQKQKIKEGLYKDAPTPADPKWEEDYKYFKKSYFFKEFHLWTDSYIFSHTDSYVSTSANNDDEIPRYYDKYDFYEYFILNNIFLQDTGPDDILVKLSEKGKYFIKMYEFEEERGLL